MAIEIDGDSHDYKYEEDVIRQKKMESLGVHFLRFLDMDVKKDMNNVLREIEHWVLEHQEPTPSLSKEITHPQPLQGGESVSANLKS